MGDSRLPSGDPDADPEQDIYPARASADYSYDLLQHVVAGRVAERVVDGLEAIDVEEQQRCPLAETAPTLDGMHETCVQVAPVERAGQRVRDRLGFEPPDVIAQHPQPDRRRR